jgi:hypothetical protein
MVLVHTFGFGDILTYAILNSDENVCIEKHENFQKRSIRSRYEICNHQGRSTLSIPLIKGKNQGQQITEVLISYEEDWAALHLKSIISAYGKAPYFEHYIDYIESTLSIKPATLWEFNSNCIELCLKLLKTKVSVSTSISYEFEVKADVLDIRKGNSVEILYPTYQQCFSERFDFIENLSIIDLLMCLGPESKSYLNSIYNLLKP